jgi:DsbC/DsbD-like thiol-disulfide interchange protein
MKGFLSKVSIFSSTRSKWVSFFLFVAMLNASMVEAIPSFQKFKEDSDPIHFKLTTIVDPESIKPGGRFALYVKIELSAGWHIYSLYTKGVEGQPLATEISLNSGMFVAHGLWEEPAPVIAWDGALRRVVKTHQQVVEFRRWYSVVESLSLGSYQIRGNVVFRACNNKVCNLPKKIFYETKINVLSDTH